MKKTHWRWGVVGTGRIAQDFVQALTNSDRGVAHAVASRQLASAQEFATRFGIPRAFGSYDELFDDPQVGWY